MSNQIVLPTFQGEVVKKDGLCYEFMGYEPLETTHENPDGTFTDCEDCARIPSETPPSEAPPAALETCQCSDTGGGGNDNYPRMQVTLSWVGGPTQRGFLDCQWESGVPKDVCASFYSCSPMGIPTPSDFSFSYTGKEYWYLQHYSGSPYSYQYLRFTNYGKHHRFGATNTARFMVNNYWRITIDTSTHMRLHRYNRRSSGGWISPTYTVPSWTTITRNWYNYDFSGGGSVTIPNLSAMPWAGVIPDEMDGTATLQGVDPDMVISWTKGPAGDISVWGC